ncbi:Uroporphyrinogen-III methyltransferase [invertebrate metagenome]|uniref:uroporphyrinogen-III C-methyltransferase n=1 Tax=invertebrate metagenome TaxID=1711999 RepID=A0A484HAR9_9ZZZZ
MRGGGVYIVGTGPGDPDLLTVKAVRLLQKAEVVVFDRLVSPEILNLVPTSTTRIYAGKGPRNHHMQQEQINELLASLVRRGCTVVRVKGGDPYIFGRGSEETEYLARHHIPFEVVPGITAASGGSAYAGIPLTHRGLATSVRYLTGHLRDGLELDHDWQSLTDRNTTLVVYMGLTNFEHIAGKLIAHGLDSAMPAAAIQNATTFRQRRVLGTLGNLAIRVREAGLSAPVIFIIGRVVSLADMLNWFRSDTAADRE